MIPLNIKIGDYVYATRWADGDKNDPHAVGLVTRISRVGDKGYISVDVTGERLFGHAAKIKNKNYFHVIFSDNRPLCISPKRVNSICKKILENKKDFINDRK